MKKILHFVVSIKATETAKQGTLLSKKKIYIYIYISEYIFPNLHNEKNQSKLLKQERYQKPMIMITTATG